MHRHHLVAAWVNDFDGNLFILTSGEGKGCCAAELLKLVLVDDTFEGAGDFVPRFLSGKKACVIQKVRPS